MEFIEIILKHMEQQNISAYKLCKDLELKQQTFSNWKDGKMPSVDKAIKIISYLGLSADEVFELKTGQYTPEEHKLIQAYRNAEPEMKAATKKLLDL